MRRLILLLAVLAFAIAASPLFAQSCEMQYDFCLTACSGDFGPVHPSCVPNCTRQYFYCTLQGGCSPWPCPPPN